MMQRAALPSPIRENRTLTFGSSFVERSAVAKQPESPSGFMTSSSLDSSPRLGLRAQTSMSKGRTSESTAPFGQSQQVRKRDGHMFIVSPTTDKIPCFVRAQANLLAGDMTIYTGDGYAELHRQFKLGGMHRLEVKVKGSNLLILDQDNGIWLLCASHDEALDWADFLCSPIPSKPPLIISATEGLSVPFKAGPSPSPPAVAHKPSSSRSRNKPSHLQPVSTNSNATDCREFIQDPLSSPNIREGNSNLLVQLSGKSTNRQHTAFPSPRRMLNFGGDSNVEGLSMHSSGGSPQRGFTASVSSRSKSRSKHSRSDQESSQQTTLTPAEQRALKAKIIETQLRDAIKIQEALEASKQKSIEEEERKKQLEEQHRLETELLARNYRERAPTALAEHRDKAKETLWAIAERKRMTLSESLQEREYRRQQYMVLASEQRRVLKENEEYIMQLRYEHLRAKWEISQQRRGEEIEMYRERAIRRENEIAQAIEDNKMDKERFEADMAEHFEKLNRDRIAEFERQEYQAQLEAERVFVLQEKALRQREERIYSEALT